MTDQPTPIDLPTFRTWLSEHPTQIVGYCSDPNHCPVATYLHSLDPHAERISVQHQTTYWDGISFTNPAWLHSFIAAVDAWPEDTDQSDRIVGADCILILDSQHQGALL